MKALALGLQSLRTVPAQCILPASSSLCLVLQAGVPIRWYQIYIVVQCHHQMSGESGIGRKSKSVLKNKIERLLHLSELEFTQTVQYSTQ